MNLFQQDLITITKIHAVHKYIADNNTPKLLHYGNHCSTYELIFFLSGENETTVEQNMIHDCSNLLRYLPKETNLKNYTVRVLQPSVCIDVYFDALKPMPEHAFGIPNLNILRDHFLRLYDVWDKKQTGYYSLSMAILYEIVYRLQKQNQTSDYISSVQKQSIKKAHDYILQHYRNSSFDHKVLPKLCDRKHSSFYDTFQKIYSVSPTRMVTQLRISYAKELLVTSQYSMAEIAELCGFKNQYYFSSVFKKQTGFPPSKYNVQSL